MLHENFRRFFEALPKDAHPMPVCAAAVGALATFYQEPETRRRACTTRSSRLIAKMPTIAAYSYKHSIGQPFIYPQNKLDYCVELPAHDVRDAVRGLRGRSGARARRSTCC